jgi:nucleotide-binding universal stress UspA family protein
MKTILVPVDFSAVSRHVIDEAAALAKATNARIVLMHSVARPPIIVTDLAPLAGEALQLTNDLEKAADRHLRRFQRALSARGFEAETVVTSGFPVTHILAQARKVRADYVVIGSHGHTAFYDLVIGSVASGVLKRSTCPVLVVPSPKKGKTPGSSTPSRMARRR